METVSDVFDGAISTAHDNSVKHSNDLIGTLTETWRCCCLPAGEVIIVSNT